MLQLGSPQELPKRVRLVVDVSGSMYRFNGHDSRLTREMEATLMMMEAFEDYEHKIKVKSRRWSLVIRSFIWKYMHVHMPAGMHASKHTCTHACMHARTLS